MDEDSEELRGRIVYSLDRHNYYGGRHADTDKFCSRLSKFSRKKILKEVGKLAKERIILFYKTHHGNDILLNNKKKKEIDEIIEPIRKELYEF